MPRATIRLSLQYKHSPFLQFIFQTHLESINSNSTPLFLFPLSSTLNPFLTRPSHVTRMSLSGCCLTGAIQKRMQEKVQHKRSFVWLVRNETPVSSHLCSSQEFRLFFVRMAEIRAFLQPGSGLCSAVPRGSRQQGS